MPPSCTIGNDFVTVLTISKYSRSGTDDHCKAFEIPASAAPSFVLAVELFHRRDNIFCGAALECFPVLLWQLREESREDLFEGRIYCL